MKEMHIPHLIILSGIILILNFIACDIKLVDEVSNEVTVASRQITFNSGSKRGPAWSPDGTMIAYSNSTVSIPFSRYSIHTGYQGQIGYLNDEPNEEPSITQDGKWVTYRSRSRRRIYIYSLETEEEYAITTVDSPCYGPVWSPDGRSICYNNLRRDNDYSLWVFSLDDSSHREVAHVEGYAFVSPSWFQDGENIIFRAHCWADNNEYLWAVSIVTGAITGYSDNAQYDFNSPSISPDETKVAFISSYEGLEGWPVWIFDIYQDSIYQFSTDKYTRYPVWSPDGSMLAYSSYNNYCIKVFTADQDSITKIGTASGYFYPHWLSDNESIVFYFDWVKEYMTSLWMVGLDNFNLTQLSNYETGHSSQYNMNPSWGLKGQEIYFYCSSGLSASGIYSCKIEDFRHKYHFYGGDPEISQDGEWMVYDRYNDIYLYHLENQTHTNLSDNISHSLYDPTLSQDNTQLACVYSGYFFIYQVEDSSLIETNRLYGPWSAPAWSPEHSVYGSCIAIVKNGGSDLNRSDESGIHLLNPETMETRFIIFGGTDPSWSPNGNSLCYVNKEDNQIYTKEIFYEIDDE